MEETHNVVSEKTPPNKGLSLAFEGTQLGYEASRLLKDIAKMIENQSSNYHVTIEIAHTNASTDDNKQDEEYLPLSDFLQND
ncbi:hypothetical protein [Shouchella shacheensis]|uniref:hypothetical protein n=1 Tax=Shouchella shacheensis TaxID=1649580 RepID=UPI000740288C|nr:hypothetical protein [Shouchella shacheensis]